jgi:ribosome biogenesis protein Nip4
LSAGKGRRLTFDSPSLVELNKIKEGLRKFLDSEEIDFLLRDKQIIIGHGRRVEAYLLSKSLWTIYQSLRKWRHPYFIGIFLGEIRGEILQPSLHICHRLSTGKVDRKVIVTPQGEQQFLYGRNLDSNHLYTLQEESVNSELLVLNQLGEVLGYGILEKEHGGKLKIRNRKDLGWYLRRGG